VHETLERSPALRGLTFLQISDSHVGFHLPPNPNALGTLKEAVAKVRAMPKKPAFMIHTGDISHLSLTQFDDADRMHGHDCEKPSPTRLMASRECW
jgi:hypothetical protein